MKSEIGKGFNISITSYIEIFELCYTVHQGGEETWYVTTKDETAF